MKHQLAVSADFQKWQNSPIVWLGFVSNNALVENKPQSIFKAAAIPRTTVIGCCKQNSCNWGEKASFLLSK